MFYFTEGFLREKPIWLSSSAKTFFCSVFLTVILFLFPFEKTTAQNYTVSRFDYTWCTNSYPTPYVTGNFSIIEQATAVGGHDGFTKNQSNKTLIIDLPAGFEFNTAAASTITEGGTPEPMTISWVFTSTTRITVTISTPNSNNQINSLDFNNFQIRAISSGSSGDILRNGGTFQIDQSTGNPTASESLGMLSAATPFVYTGSSVTQSNLSNVTQFSINQDIIRIKISGTGTCGGTVTQFDFSTVGGNGTGTDLPATNITNAKVYYTGSSSTFTTTGYFGTVASPNGAFTITGSQDLTNTDNYFWLTYDVPGSANTGAGSNRLDAQLTDFILNGSTISNMTTPAPVGSRTIIGATFYYSRMSGSWNGTANLWSLTSGGATCSCQPNGSGVVVIDVGHTVTADATRTVDVIQINNTATLTGSSPLTVNSTLLTLGSGVFTLTGQLSVLGNVSLSGTGSSSDTKIIDINGDLTVNAGTSLTASGGTSGGVDQNIYVGGNLTVDGTLQQTGGKDIILDVGAAFILGGTGTITTSRTLCMNTGSKSVPSGANLTINSNFKINGAYTLTNNGTVSLNGNLDGTNESAKWFNKNGGVFNYAGSTDMFNTTGTLDAATSTNTVNYNGAAQRIILPNNSGQYSNLTFSGSSTKTLPADILISGDFISNATMDPNGNGVSFNGSVAQTISGTVTPTFFGLTINNSSATGVTLSRSVNASNSLILTAGLLNTTSVNILTMQNGSTAPALTAASTSYVNGPMKYQKSTSGSSVLNLPIGKSPDCRPAILTVNHSTTTLYNYQAESFNADPYVTFGSIVTDIPATVDTISGVHYITIARTDNAGTSQPSASLSGNQTIQMFFGTNDFVYQGANLTIVKNTSATPATWIDIGGSCALGNFSTPQAGSITSTSSPSAFSSFSSFALGSLKTGWNSLPIELLSFTAVPNNERVDIKWSTSTETNNDYFTIEKSKDGRNFTKLIDVKGAGNSTSLKEYFDIDPEPYVGTSYYRLKQTDKNGAYKYFYMIPVTFNGNKNITLFPNPIGKGEPINIKVTGYPSEEVLVVLRDMSGKEFSSKVLVTEESDHIFSVSTLTEIPAGVYMVVASSNNKIYSYKLVVQ
jgi:hypothetical protein